MRTVPNSIITGMQNNWEKGFLINICGDETLWYSTKDITVMNNDMELNIIADKLSYRFSEKKSLPLSNLTSEMNLNSGEFYFEANDFSIDLVNIENYYLELLTKNIINRAVIVYLFYVPPNANVILLTDMMIIQVSIVKSVYATDKNIRILCSTKNNFQNRSFPSKIISKKDFPFAPKESIGKCVPILFGNFTGSDPKIGIFNLAPSICIDENSSQYIFAMNDCSDIKPYLIKNDIQNEIISNWNASVNENISEIQIEDKITAVSYIRPLLKGSQMDSAYDSNYKNAVDPDINSSITVSSNTNFYLKFDEIGYLGTPIFYSGTNTFGNLRLFFQLGNVINGSTGKAAKVKYFQNGEFAYINNYDIYASMSDNEVDFLFYFPLNNFYEILSQIEIGISVEPNATVELKNIYAKFKFSLI